MHFLTTYKLFILLMLVAVLANCIVLAINTPNPERNFNTIMVSCNSYNK